MSKIQNSVRPSAPAMFMQTFISKRQASFRWQLFWLDVYSSASIKVGSSSRSQELHHKQRTLPCLNKTRRKYLLVGASHSVCLWPSVWGQAWESEVAKILFICGCLESISTSGRKTRTQVLEEWGLPTAAAQGEERTVDHMRESLFRSCFFIKQE